MSCNQNVNLVERLLEPFLKVDEKSFRCSVIRRHDFYLNDIVNILDTAVFPCSLIWSRQRTYRNGAKSFDQICLDCSEFLNLDISSVVVF
jgi:hypothetical protein